MELIIIETPDKIFASDVFTSWETSRLGYHFVDGKIPEKSFKNKLVYNCKNSTNN